MDMHQSGFTREPRRNQASQNRVLELARDPTTNRQKGRKLGVMLIAPLEDVGHHMRDIIDRCTSESALSYALDGISELAPSVFQGGGGATHHGDDALEKRRDAGAIPGLGHRHRDAMNLPQGGGSRVQVVVTGIERSKGQDFAGSQSATDIDEPESAM